MNCISRIIKGGRINQGNCQSEVTIRTIPFLFSETIFYRLTVTPTRIYDILPGRR